MFSNWTNLSKETLSIITNIIIYHQHLLVAISRVVPNPWKCHQHIKNHSSRVIGPWIPRLLCRPKMLKPSTSKHSLSFPSEHFGPRPHSTPSWLVIGSRCWKDLTLPYLMFDQGPRPHFTILGVWSRSRTSLHPSLPCLECNKGPGSHSIPGVWSGSSSKRHSLNTAY